MNTSLLPRVLFWIQAPVFCFLVFIDQNHSQNALVTSVFLSPSAIQGWLKILVMSLKVPRFACVTTPGMVSWSVFCLLCHCATRSCGYHLQVDATHIPPQPLGLLPNSVPAAQDLVSTWFLLERGIPLLYMRAPCSFTWHCVPSSLMVLL